ncbi:MULTISPECIES: WhiB family transcriptional regulator [Streptomyces]|uniref:Transcriptional regulator WhiB n=1 Tax=Streptomyces argyrophylli TaxID=2726118 RepID=A0A6M4PDJ2_9ACTN|nr:MULTISPECIES: WhiB family transcriptional regulator [Streptomyces]QJS09208.1 WhiB family transcriptional regulator [Streptomyces argyrophyllae]
MKSTTKPLLRLWEWQARAACRGMKSSMFFSPAGERGGARRRREARAVAVCRGCPVQSDCRSFAENSRQAYGVWGGATERQRRALGPGS